MNTSTMTKPHLIDGVQRNAKYPNTFEIPPITTRENLSVGDYAKIGLETSERGGERFWVKIETVMANDSEIRYQGSLDNYLAVYPEFEYGHTFEFEPKHVLQVLW